MPKAIKVEGLSKAYQLGDFGTGTISRDIERFIARIRGKEDPFLRIGEINDRTSKGESDIVWSLKDLNFTIEQGDAVGIIGRNGAGKSTLLKILSRITSPTTGSVKIKGRVASLLEVGTGFHPELTGRENIFLNGAILGMRKKEITRKFDEIVDFAGVERYIDTPVKRYSSGMYVRLAFAVAAHLESEILIVDEVLAVGDAEFQKKCLGKMGDVSKGEGRTVLFVSHNMGAIMSFCSNSILLDKGTITYAGLTPDVINKMENIYNSGATGGYWLNPQTNAEKALLQSITIYNDDKKTGSTQFMSNEAIHIEFKVAFFESINAVKIGYDLVKDGSIIYRSHHTDNNLKSTFNKNEHLIYTCTIPPNFLNHGTYQICPQFSVHGLHTLINTNEPVLSFEVELHKDNHFKIMLTQSNFPGAIFPQLNWTEDSYED